jgi:NitT/TauT family transport system ATP-binding protein
MPHPDPDPILELRGVSMDFVQPRGSPRRVLEGIDVKIYAEEVVALLGPSGCGKSTILRILAGLTVPTRGEVRYRGALVAGISPHVGFVFQSFALFPWMTVQENIEAALVALGTAAEETTSRAARVIRLVGLAGSEEAYPRELSGGMKQRVGMARALSLEPELLFMDEPFSQVDALTAESLRAEVLDIWAVKERNPRSILMVSHDIKEVAYMADRVVVLDANPGRVRTVIRNDLPRPRDYRSAGLQLMVDRLHDIITGMEMPDVPAPAAVTFEPVPDAGAGEVVGLLEYLDARGGREDVFRIAAETDREFGALISVVNAAELLDFVTTPKRTVVLAPLGEKMVRASPAERKAIWREQILELRLFQQVRDAIQRNERQRTTKEFVLETIAVMMPQEDYEKVFQRLVGWARYGELFAYDDDTELLSLQ